jgi:hypothetical protein
MARRSGGDIVNKRAIITALRDCRDTLTREMPNMKPTGALYQIVGRVLAAIDALATFITHDPRIFHDKGTTGYPSRWDGEEG